MSQKQISAMMIVAVAVILVGVIALAMACTNLRPAEAPANSTAVFATAEAGAPTTSGLITEFTDTDATDFIPVEAEVWLTEPLEVSPEPTETRYLTIYEGEGYIDAPMDKNTQNVVKIVSEEYGVPWELVMAVCYVESGFDQYAISSHGDMGFMQVAPVNQGWLAAELGITDLFDAEQNIRAGTHILATKIAESDGDFTIALMKYNRGDAVALEQMRQGIFSTDYTEKVLAKYYEYLSY